MFKQTNHVSDFAKKAETKRGSLVNDRAKEFFDRCIEIFQPLEVHIAEINTDYLLNKISAACEFYSSGECELSVSEINEILGMTLYPLICFSAGLNDEAERFILEVDQLLAKKTSESGAVLHG